MTNILHIIRESDIVGRLEYNRKSDTLSLHYEDGWRFRPDGFPVSVSLPMESGSKDHESVGRFLQGLLPDNDAVLSAWGKRFQVSSRNPFDLIKYVGEDCAGGLQFVRPERLDSILSGELDSMTELSENDLENRLAALTGPTRSVPGREGGRFSLAGAQTKDALHLLDGKWFEPSGRIPSTHILKPQPPDLEEHVLNEHFCLELAGRTGLAVAHSEIITIGGENVLSVRRYDRKVILPGGSMIRLHQEDLCQALGHYPRDKYQSDGGPTAADIVALLKREASHPEDDIYGFISGLAFNWIIYGSDAHSKNYSLIHFEGSRLFLAPLYDIASNLAHDGDPKSSHRKLAMKIGGDYRLHRIDVGKWEKLAIESSLDPKKVNFWVNRMIDKVEEHVGSVAEEIGEYCETDFIDRLTCLILERVEACRKSMAIGK